MLERGSVACVVCRAVGVYSESDVRGWGRDRDVGLCLSAEVIAPLHNVKIEGKILEKNV